MYQNNETAAMHSVELYNKNSVETELLVSCHSETFSSLQEICKAAEQVQSAANDQ